MKTKNLVLFLALALSLVQILSLGVFADEYDLYDEDFEEMYEDDVEYDDYDADLDSEIPDEVFWFFYSIFGFAVPAVGAFVGYRISRSPKRGYPKYWLIFSGICLAWIFFAVILMLILLL